MTDVTRGVRRAVLAAGLLVLASATDSFSSPAVVLPRGGEGDQAASGRSMGDCLLVIPPDWKLTYPYSERFAASGERAVTPQHMMDLAAIRFATDGLESVGPNGERVFHEPDLQSFPGALVRTPFSQGLVELMMVQARSPLDQVTVQKWLKNQGVPILGYLPDLAYLVRIDRPTLVSLTTLPSVYWVGLFQPAFRIHPKLDFIIQEDPDHLLKLRASFDLADYASETALLAELQTTSVKILDITRMATFWSVRMEAPARVARDLAVLRGSLWVERFLDFELHNNIARTSVASTPTGRGPTTPGPIMDIEDVWAKGIRGEGQVASAADTGLSTGDITTPDSLHWDFGQTGSTTNPMRVLAGYALGRTTWDDNQTTGGGHGTHTSGSIVGNGIRSDSIPDTNTFPTTSFAGAAPKAQYVFQSVMDSGGGLGGLPADLNTLFLQAYNTCDPAFPTRCARVHSNSWGAANAGAYDTDSQNVDKFVWDHKDMVITFSAGNEGGDGQYWNARNRCVTNGKPIDGVIDDDTIGTPATAKNCITVGATENYRPDFVYEYPEGDCTPGATDPKGQQAWNWFDYCSFSANPIANDLMADNASGMGAFSSRGATDDGRFKPDVTAPGIAIISTRTNLNQAYEQWGICNVPTAQRSYYVSMGGTSMANPLTAGTATLVRQYFVDGWHANHSLVTNTAAVPADGFNPSAALVKATLINGAWDMAPGQYGSTSPQPEIPPNWDRSVPRDLPNNAEGYGRIDLEHSLFPGSGWGDVSGRKLEVHDVSPGLVTGGEGLYTFTVTANTNPFIVTLVWTDPYGATGAATELVNNLNLEVTDPTSQRYLSNRKSAPGTTQDTKNNVEQVYISTPTVGTWSIRVHGYAVPGNGQPGTTTQPYALVISGVSSTCTAPGAPTLTSTTGDCAGVNLSWTAGTGTTNSYNVYRSANTSCPVGTLTKLNASPIPSGTLTYADTTAVAGTTYTYVVRGACDAGGATESPNSNCRPGTRLAPPPVPTGLTATPACSSVGLSWSASSGATSYNVLRGTSCGGVTLLASGVTGTTYTDGTAVPGTAYYYAVQAVGSCASATSACAGPTASQTYHLQVESAYVSGYRDMTPSTEFEVAVQQASTADITAAGEYQIGGATPLQWISPAYTGDANLASSPWTFDVYGLTTGSGAAGQLYAKVYRYNGGFPLLLFTTGYASPNISTATAQTRFTWTHTPPAGTSVPTGDRLFVEIWVHATAGNPGGTSTVYDTASGQTLTRGSVSSGSYISTKICDGSYEDIREAGTPNFGLLDVVWTIPLTSGGSSWVFNSTAWISGTVEPIQLQYSTGSATGPWTNMFTFNGTVSPGCPPTTQTYNLGTAPQGKSTIWVRATNVNTATRNHVFFDYIAVATSVPTPAPHFTLNYDSASADSQVTALTDCPASVNTAQFLTATATNQNVKLEWVNPNTGSYGTTRICRKTGSYPTGPTDGTHVDRKGLAGTYDTVTDDGSTVLGSIANDTTYYYAAYVNTTDSGSGTWSGGKFVKARPFDTTGAAKWAYTTGATAIAPPGIIPGTGMWAVSNDRLLHALQAGGGGGVWRAEPFAMNGPSQARPGPVSSSAVPGHARVVFIGAQDGYAYAVDADSGDQIWRSADDFGLVQAGLTGTFTSFGGTWDLLFVATRNAGARNRIVAINPATGQTLWSWDNPAGSAIGIISAQPYVHYGSNRLFFASRDGDSGYNVWGLTFTNTGVTSYWRLDTDDVDARVVPDRAGTTLFVGTTTGKVLGVNAATGALKWTYTCSPADGAVKSEVVPERTGGAVYFATTGRIWRLDVTDTTATKRWDLAVSSPSAPLLALTTPRRLLLGSAAGAYLQVSDLDTTPTTTQVTLGDGSSVLGAVTLDTTTELTYVGSDAGIIYAVQTPLSGAKAQLGGPIPTGTEPVREAPNVGGPCQIDFVSSGRQGPPVIRVAKTLDLGIPVTIAPTTRQPSLLELRLYTPNGHLYQSVTTPVRQPGEQAGRRAVDGYPYPVPERVLARGEKDGTPTLGLTVSVPLAGTSVVTNSLYGTWQIVPYLDGGPVPCGPSASVVIQER